MTRRKSDGVDDSPAAEIDDAEAIEAGDLFQDGGRVQAQDLGFIFCLFKVLGHVRPIQVDEEQLLFQRRAVLEPSAQDLLEPVAETGGVDVSDLVVGWDILILVQVSPRRSHLGGLEGRTLEGPGRPRQQRP
jgi:hypothetical protein